VIADAIEINFDIKTRTQSDKIQNYLIDFFNQIYGLYYSEFSKKTGIYTEPFSFIGYIAIASELYGRDNWKDVLVNILNQIDFTEDNPFYQEIKKYQINISKAKNRGGKIMYIGDKVALDNLRNRSICVRIDKGIRNITNEYDLAVENLVYVENIATVEQDEIDIITKGSMVRYRPITVIIR